MRAGGQTCIRWFQGPQPTRPRHLMGPNRGAQERERAAIKAERKAVAHAHKIVAIWIARQAGGRDSLMEDAINEIARFRQYGRINRSYRREPKLLKLSRQRRQTCTSNRLLSLRRKASGCTNFVTEVIIVPAFVSECCSTRIALITMSGVCLIRNSGRLKGTGALGPGGPKIAGIEAKPIYPGVGFPMAALASACTKP
jgi:hypothetical protein